MERDVILRNATIALAIIGIVSLVGVNFIPDSLEQSILASGWPITLDENDATYLNTSFVRGFHLGPGQTCNVYVSNTLNTNITETVTVTVRFATYGEYLDDFENDRGASDLSGEPFMYSSVAYPISATRNVVSSLTIGEGDSYQIEFMGDGDGTPDTIWSVPGDYVVAVYVANSGGIGTTVTFNMQISVDGQGDMIRTVMMWIGGIALAAAAIIGIALIILIRKR